MDLFRPAILEILEDFSAALDRGDPAHCYRERVQGNGRPQEEEHAQQVHFIISSGLSN